MRAMSAQRRVVSILAVTQILSWGSLYYAFAVLSPAMQRDLGMRPEALVAAFSGAMLVSGLAAPLIGRLLDRLGGRAVMAMGSVASGAGLMMLGGAHSAFAYWAAWGLLGLAMAMTLYEAAFATINREIEHDPRRAMSTLSLFGGLASTLFWPSTLALDGALGWRGTYFAYGLVHLAVCMPLHLLLPAGPRAMTHSAAGSAALPLGAAMRHPAFWKLAAAFAANSFIFSGLAVHLIAILGRMGHSLNLVVMLAAVIGPMQVLGRLGEMTVGRRFSAGMIGLCTFLALPLALAVLAGFGTNAAVVLVFCVLYGASNGIMTIVRGTVPQELFGRAHYGSIAGMLAAPSLVCKALGPVALAALLAAGIAPATLVWVLMAASLVSLAFFAGVLPGWRKPATPGVKAV